MSQIFEDSRQQEIEAYIQKTMSQEEVLIFEKKLATDKLLQEDVLLQESLQDSFNEDSWAILKNDPNNKALQELKTTLRSEAYVDISETIQEVGGDYQKKSQKKEQQNDKRLYYRIAIAAAVLLLCGLPFMINSQSNTIYDQYQNWESLPSLIEKGNTQTKVAEGESLYFSENYEESILYFKNTMDANDPYYSYRLLYLGASYFKIGDVEKAHDTYDTLIATNTLQSSYGYWYKLLMYLYVENSEKVNEMLALIVSNPDHYNYAEAKKIQEAL